MRRIRSESWTFIWQPKVRIQAVLVPSDPEGAVAEGAPGLREIMTGVAVRVAACGVSVVSLIVFLRLVDAGSHGDLSRTALELEFPYLEVARPRRPPKYSRDGASFLLPYRKHRPIAQPPPHPLLPPHLARLCRGDLSHRHHLPTPHPLHRA